MTIEFPSTKAIKDQIRNSIGQTVTFVIKGTPVACPICSSGYSNYDPVNESSLDAFCPTCSGRYWLDVNENVPVTGHVRWMTGDEPERLVAGELLSGDCSITISSSALTESQIVNIREVHADSRKLEVYRTIYKGVPERDRICFICREWGKE